jgi:hypothetical protein
METDPRQRYSDIQGFLDDIGASQASAVLFDFTNPPGNSAADITIQTPIPLINGENIVVASPFAYASQDAMLGTPAVSRSSLSGQAAHIRGMRENQQNRTRVPLLILCLLLVIGLAGTLLMALTAKSEGKPQSTTTPIVESKPTRTPTRQATKSATTRATATIAVPTATMPALEPLPTTAPTEKPTTPPTASVPTATPTLTPTATTVSQPAITCIVKATKNTEWSGGFTMDITITNSSQQTIEDWQLSWRFDGDQVVTSAWNGQYQQDGKQVTMESSSWNSTIDPEKNASVGMNISARNSHHLPTQFTLNGVACQ